MEKYNPAKIEKKWQKKWQDEKTFETRDDSSGSKFYALDMFPYPSGAGLHVGHPEGYIATDIMSRFRKMKFGDSVLHPMGFDSFGLPTENYAIKVGRNPKEITEENVKNFVRQLKMFGFSYDWDRMVKTSDPEYYRWTQWMFRELYKKGLAYKKEAPVNWCDGCQTVLAREQVVSGKCERCQGEVVQKNLSQWFFKTTAYAEELLADIDGLDWPEPIKSAQRNWIGKSEGAEVIFSIKESDDSLKVFTTRPDTLFGATFMVVAPEHPIIAKNKDKISNFSEIEAYKKESQKKNELERTDLNKNKTGIEVSGLVAINPVNEEEIPVFVADYVMMNYGTGAIMAVPAHDERDFEFAKKYNIEIREVISGGNIDLEAFTELEKGKMVNSDFLNDMLPKEAKQKMIEWLEEKSLGRKQINYKLRDWLISRQRYWGAPIPIVYCPKCGEVLVEEKELPVMLPDDVDFQPTGESPLASSKSFHQVSCPICGETEGVRRESDTMDTFVCSSWYFLRYADPHNSARPFDLEKIKKWLPVDLYVGGAEHAVLHLLYARFFTKALADLGHLDFREPFLRLRNQGMILAEDGRKMSKSLGNVVNPDEVVEKFGADTFRLYEMFMGPLEDSKPWDTHSIAGIKRFLDRTWNLQNLLSEESTEKEEKAIKKVLHQTIKKVTSDIEEMKYNTAISQMMIFVNTVEKEKFITKEVLEKFITLLSPFAPHIAEEIWEKLSDEQETIDKTWPEHDETLIVDDELEIVVQVNGKIRDKMTIPADLPEDQVKEKALALENIEKWVAGQDIKKVIYVKGKLVSVVV
jgi:leucyl-tRNA synthetase